MRRFWIFAALAVAASVPVRAQQAPAAKAAPAPPAIALPSGMMWQKAGDGFVLADFRGLTLYTSSADAPGKSACNGACVDEWPPLPAPMMATVSGDWSVIARSDGTGQWAYKGKPLYLSVKDAKPGETAGETAAKTWTAVRP